MSAPATATFHTFVVDQIYSSADGEVQFIVLRESAGAAGQDQFAGQALSSTHAGVTKSFGFSVNLPSPATAGKHVLLASQGYVALRNRPAGASLPAPDYTLPNRFLATDGGSVNFASVDSLIYAALPVDGSNALFGDGAVGVNNPINFSGAASQVPVVPTLAVEYYHAGFNHYFVSSLAPDIDSLDSGRAAGWARTGETYNVMPIASGTPPAGVFGPVCRFYIPPERGDSHFFSASVDECDSVLRLSMTDPNYIGFVLETRNAYFAVLPDGATGACPTGLRPLYRLWNQRTDSNHRYTTSLAIKAQMLALGSVAEGYGPDTVAMCVI